MCRTRADSSCECFQPLSDDDHQSARNWRAVNPVACRVLRLQSPVIRGLQQERSKTGVLVRANTLTHSIAGVWILDDLKLVLLIVVKEGPRRR